MTTSKLTVDEGTQTPLATYEINEDAEDKQLARTVLNAEDGTELGTVGDPLNVAAASLPLPTGAATAANQQTDALTDTELRASPVPVSGTVSVNEPVSVDDNGGSLTVDNTVLSVVGGGTEATAQRVTIANDSTGVVSVDDNGGSLTVDGTVAVTDGGGSITVDGPLTDAQLRAAAVPVSLSSDIEIGAVELKNGTDDTRATVTAANALKVDGSAVTQPISGTVTVNEPVSVDDNGGSLTVDGPLTDAELRATPVPVSATNLDIRDLTFAADKVDASGTVLGAGTNAIGKLAANSGVDIGDVDVTSLPSLPAGTNNIGDVDVLTLPALPAGTNNIGDVDVASLPSDVALADDAAFTPATTKVIGAGFFADETSTDSVDEGDIGAARMTPDRRAYAVNTPHSAGGCDIFRSLDLDETEEEVQATAGTLYGYYIANLATTTRFVKFYNATAANVTVGTTTPVLTLPIPGNATDDIGANILGGVGIKFDTAITVAATTGLADNDTGAPAANDVVVNVYFK